MRTRLSCPGCGRTDRDKQRFAITAVAIRDKIPETPDQLPFLQGEVITVLEQRDGGLYWVRPAPIAIFFFYRGQRLSKEPVANGVARMCR